LQRKQTSLPRTPIAESGQGIEAARICVKPVHRHVDASPREQARRDCGEKATCGPMAAEGCPVFLRKRRWRAMDPSGRWRSSNAIGSIEQRAIASGRRPRPFLACALA
jgi:hypothetical protein